MHQLPQEIWNQIAESVPLATPAAQAAFAVPPEQAEAMMETWGTLEKQAGTPAWAIVPLQEVLPLYLEAAALTEWKRRHPEFLSALPEALSLAEAVALMSRERQWKAAQSSTFSAILQSDQTATRWLASAKAARRKAA